MTRFDHLHVCIRCGLKCAPDNRTGTLYRGTPAFEHLHCSTIYRGSDVHWQDKPDPHAPGEIHVHDRKDGLRDIYDIRSLRKLHPVMREVLPVTGDMAEGWAQSYTTDPSDAEAVCRIRQEMGTLFEPVLFVVMPVHLAPPGSIWLIDGVHRAIGLINRGLRHLPAVVLTDAEVRRYRLRGTPEELDARITAMGGRRIA